MALTSAPPSPAAAGIGVSGRQLAGKAITGGLVYRAAWPAARQGLHFYGDFGSGRLWALRRDGDTWATTIVMDTALSISTFGEDEAGRLYLADYGGGAYLLTRGTYLPLVRASR